MFDVQTVILGIACVLIVLLAIWAAYMQAPLRRFQKASEKEFLGKVRDLEDILFQLERNQTPSPERMREAAASPRLRGELYTMLIYHRRQELFPGEYFNWESFAEGEMVEWISHPHELGCAPDELELMAKVQVGDAVPLTYFVYRFRMKSPMNWRRKGGWREWRGRINFALSREVAVATHVVFMKRTKPGLRKDTWNTCAD